MKLIFPILSCVLFSVVSISAEEKPSLWQRFTNFFDPAPSATGNGELELEIQKLDEEIKTLRGEFRREHRPQRKSMLRKELDERSHQRDSLLHLLENKPTSKDTANIEIKKETLSKDSTKTEIKNTPIPKDTVRIIEREIIREIIRDTIYIRDTVYICDSTKTSISPEAGQ